MLHVYDAHAQASGLEIPRIWGRAARRAESTYNGCAYAVHEWDSDAARGRAGHIVAKETRQTDCPNASINADAAGSFHKYSRLAVLCDSAIGPELRSLGIIAMSDREERSGRVITTHHIYHAPADKIAEASQREVAAGRDGIRFVVYKGGEYSALEGLSAYAHGECLIANEPELEQHDATVHLPALIALRGMATLVNMQATARELMDWAQPASGRDRQRVMSAIVNFMSRANASVEPTTVTDMDPTSSSLRSLAGLAGVVPEQVAHELQLRTQLQSVYYLS